MALTHHTFTAEVEWFGPSEGHEARRSFSRAHVVRAAGVPDIPGSAAKVFHGDADRWNPEQLLLAAVAQCHMMTFLFLAKRAGVDVVTYKSRVEGIVAMDPDGIGGEFSTISLFPDVTIRSADGVDRAAVDSLHETVTEYCFIARSVSAPIDVSAQTAFV